mmetsp:Transcript_35166/g.88618  ORF Transcript_35166/g.88618 Transcript_35166/m.88618 type:complete len:241 (-) Transcript_35166:34-756(-)
MPSLAASWALVVRSSSQRTTSAIGDAPPTDMTAAGDGGGASLKRPKAEFAPPPPAAELFEIGEATEAACLLVAAVLTASKSAKFASSFVLPTASKSAFQVSALSGRKGVPGSAPGGGPSSKRGRNQVPTEGSNWYPFSFGGAAALATGDAEGQPAGAAASQGGLSKSGGGFSPTSATTAATAAVLQSAASDAHLRRIGSGCSHVPTEGLTQKGSISTSVSWSGEADPSPTKRPTIQSITG